MYALKGQLEESWAQSKQYRDELEAMRRRLGSRPDLIAVAAATIATIRTRLSSSSAARQSARSEA